MQVTDILNALYIVIAIAFPAFMLFDLIVNLIVLWNRSKPAPAPTRTTLENQQEGQAPTRTTEPDPWTLPTDELPKVTEMPQAEPLPTLRLLPQALPQIESLPTASPELAASIFPEVAPAPKRKPGRPKKTTTTPAPTESKRKPGRPRKAA